MNPLYIALLALNALIFLDYKFYRVLTYAVVFNMIIAFIGVQSEPMSGLVLVFFGCVLFPVIMWFAIGSCEREERESLLEMTVIAAIALVAIYGFLSMIGITEDHALLFTVFAFSLVAIMTSKNLLKYIFIFDAAENTLILTAYSFFSGNMVLNIPAVIFIEIATFLPLVLLTYLTVRIYKRYRSLNPWHLWQSP
jgi:hypothetical protein